MATRNRNRTQRKNKNRSRKHRGGDGNNSCSIATKAANAATGVKKMKLMIEAKQACAGGAATVAPNRRWSSGLTMRSRRNKRQGGGDNSCSIATKAANAATGVKKMKLMIEAKQACGGGAKTVAPNKRWYNARAREGEQGAWTGSMSPTGSTVVPVKSCGNAGQNPDGTCKVASQAQSYNYVA
jgi:hypothetical protein